MTDTQNLLLWIVGIASLLAVVAVVFNIDDLFGIPIVSSMLFGCAAGCGFAYFFPNQIILPLIVGVAAAYLLSIIIAKIRTRLVSPDMNDYFY